MGKNAKKKSAAKKPAAKKTVLKSGGKKAAAPAAARTSLLPAERQAKREAEKAAEKAVERDLERGCDEMMEKIDEHPLASADVPRQTTIDFYRHLAIECNNRADGIREEMLAETGEPDES